MKLGGTTQMLVRGISLILLCCIPAFVATIVWLPAQPPTEIPTEIPTQISTPVQVPTQAIISIPGRHIPDHAAGNRKQCGNCHRYPLFDANNDPYLAEGSFSKQIPTPTPTRAPILPLPDDAPRTYIVRPTTVTSPIPRDYYAQDCELPADQSMQEYLANSEWIDDYEAGSWDCSQMSSYMEYMLENCGYHVVIRHADVEGEDYGHAWILVEFEQGWLAYECTGRYWVYPNEAVARSYEPYSYVHWNPSFYTAGVQYESIHDVWAYYKQCASGNTMQETVMRDTFLQEYGWWAE